jgi:hypothetical protein
VIKGVTANGFKVSIWKQVMVVNVMNVLNRPKFCDLLFFLFLGSTGFGTRGLLLARQVFYCVSHSFSSIFYFFCGTEI